MICVRQTSIAICVANYLLCCGLLVASDQPSAVERLTPTIVHVKAASCFGTQNEQTGTGFLWQSPTAAVTSLHVVSGCNDVRVEYDGGVSRKAAVVRFNKAADLAILQIENAPVRSILSRISSVIRPNQSLYTLGYPLNRRSVGSTVLIVRVGANKLADIVPIAVSQELRNIGSPDINLDITDLQGPLLPGSSGSPIFDEVGNLVAIADGGLEMGTVSASWGIPAKYLSDAAGFTSVNTAQAPHSRYLFGADALLPGGAKVKCGAGELVKLRSRTFKEIEHTSDDPDGLNQLVVLSMIDPTDFVFDIYQEPNSGATLSLPQGAELQGGDDVCRGSFSSGKFDIHIKFDHVTSQFDVQKKTMAFEAEEFIPPNLWQADLPFTLMRPQRRYDGLILMRKALAKLIDTSQPPKPEKYAMEVLASRGDALLEVVVRNNGYTTEVNQNRQACQTNNSSRVDCPQLNAEFLDWVKYVLGVQMTGFAKN